MTYAEQERLRKWINSLDLMTMPLHHSLLASLVALGLENLTRQHGGYGDSSQTGFPKRLHGEGEAMQMVQEDD